MGRGRLQLGVGYWVTLGAVVLVLIGVFGVVAVGGLSGINAEAVRDGIALIRDGGVGLIVRTILVAAGIGGVSTILGIGMARVLMRAGSGNGWVWVVAMVPVWMPSYAMYGAMNLARAPDTMVGRWLISYATSDPSRRWVAVWAGYAIGLLGMSVWGAVIAAMVIATDRRGRQGVYRDMMDLEPAGVIVRARVWVGLYRGALLKAWGVVGLVMLGSGVPLHLAQIETWSIVVWRALSERSVDAWGSVWVLGSPMVMVGVVGAWLVTRVVVRDATSRAMVGTGVESGVEHGERRRAGGMDWVWGAGVWGLGVVVPMLVLAVSIDDWRSMGVFWSERSDAIGHSVLIGGVVGVIGAVFAMMVAAMLGHWMRWVRWVGVSAVFACAAGALVPGVLVGASIAGSGWLNERLNGGMGELVGLLARVLVVSAVVGAVVAGRESGELLSQRWTLGGGLGDWWRAHGRTGVLACVGAGVLCGLLAVHEIEASVMITRAGVSTLSQGLLADLHYARLERLSAALLNLMIVALVVSCIGGMLMVRTKDTD
ncbi:MAG: hypothetical protein ACSHX5_10895 [Phycisphaerales bacterium]